MKSAYTRAGLANLIFGNTAWAGVGDAGGLLPSAAAGDFFYGLHDSWPGDAGSQTTGEITDANYVRQPVPRTIGAGGFTFADPTIANQAEITFPDTDAAGSAVFWSLGTDLAGAGNIVRAGALSTFSGPIVVTDSGAPNTISVCAGHGLAVNDEVALFQVKGTTIPGGLADGGLYFVETVAGDVITLSATAGPGAQLDITSGGCMILHKVARQTFTAGQSMVFRAGQFQSNES